jgi:hypothetical protein
LKGRSGPNDGAAGLIAASKTCLDNECSYVGHMKTLTGRAAKDQLAQLIAAAHEGESMTFTVRKGPEFERDVVGVIRVVFGRGE